MMTLMSEMQKLVRTLHDFYPKHKRDFPWRRTHDPYRILVSEIMLQQTQAGRVVPFYKKFIKEFPTARALAKAPLSKVLKNWQGLGYNRRAKFLHEASKVIAEESFPKFAEEIEKLPGVGHYTARAVVAFAFNKPEVFIETNIRTVFLYSCFLQQRNRGSKNKSKQISDLEILPLVAQALKKSKMQPRDFYAALMDYGAFLKASGIRVNARSKHYTKQSKFEGSARQLRGALLRELLKKPKTLSQLIKNLSPRTRGEIRHQLIRLEQEELVAHQDGRYAVV
jgi:A/G-specific adenine glycosylase